MHKICYNGVYYNEWEAILPANNKSYRYGDGLFETIKIWKGQIILADYHKSRIEQSITLLAYSFSEKVSIGKLFFQIIELCKTNNCLNAARVRLSFSNGNGGLLDNNQTLHYIIEAWPLDRTANFLNENGLVAGFFTAIKKGCDEYAKLKSASALLFSVATQFAQLQNWDDCVLLNQKGNVCESSIANIFWTKDHQVFTPALSEGCVAGVMRSYLIDALANVRETFCKPTDLLNADEVFFTNAIRGIRWVKTIEQSQYKHSTAQILYQQYIQPLYV